MSFSEATPDGPTDEQLIRLVVRVLAAVVTLTMAGGIASVAGRLDERNNAEADERDPSTIAGDLTPQGGIGPLAGTALAVYVQQRGRALQSAEGTRAAVVSFVGYRSPTEARVALDDVEVVHLLVAIPGGRPVVADSDERLDDLVQRQRAEAEEERQALMELLPTVEDPDFKAQYEVDIARLTALLASPANAVDVVFGAVVTGSADELRALATRPEIRLVDVGSDAKAPPPRTITGLRPEETNQANTPEQRPS